MNQPGCGIADLRPLNGVLVDRQALHAELDRFIDELCMERPRIDDGIVHSLTIKGGICPYGDLSRPRQLTLGGEDEDCYYVQLTATRKVMREVG